MPRADRAESVATLRTAARADRAPTTRWAAAALLHDVGKTATRARRVRRASPRPSRRPRSVIRTEVGGRGGRPTCVTPSSAPSRSEHAGARPRAVAWARSAPRSDRAGPADLIPAPVVRSRSPAPTASHDRSWRHRPLLWREFCRRNRRQLSASGGGAGRRPSSRDASTDSAMASAMSAPSARMRSTSAGIGVELARSAPARAGELDDRVGDRGLERAVPARRRTPSRRRDRLAGRRGVDLEQVRDAGLRVAVVADLGVGVGDRGLDLLGDRLRVVEQRGSCPGASRPTSTSSSSGAGGP